MLDRIDGLVEVNQLAYDNSVKKYTGFDLESMMVLLDDQQLTKLGKAIMTKETYRPGLRIDGP
jgi:hypothetical protein